MDTETRAAIADVRAASRADRDELRNEMRAELMESDRGLDARIQSHLSQAYITLMSRAFMAPSGAFFVAMVTLAIARAVYR